MPADSPQVAVAPPPTQTSMDDTGGPGNGAGPLASGSAAALGAALGGLHIAPPPERQPSRASVSTDASSEDDSLRFSSPADAAALSARASPVSRAPNAAVHAAPPGTETLAPTSSPGTAGATSPNSVASPGVGPRGGVGGVGALGSPNMGAPRPPMGRPGVMPGAGVGAGAGAGAPAPGVRPPPGQGVRPPAGRGMTGPMGMRVPMGMGGGQAPLQTRLPPSLQAKMDKLAAQRSGTPSPSATNSGGPAPAATSMGALLRQQAMRSGQPAASAQGPNAGPLGLAARRSAAGRLNLKAPPSAGPLPGSAPGGLAAARIGGRRGPPGGLSLAQMGAPTATEDSKFKDFNTIMDPSGSLKFSKAVLHSGGVDFGDGQSFKINMDEMEVLGELGKGNYGSVQKVFHRPTGVMMAMKEIRLELDESKLNGIIMELDILHRAVAAEIVEFYGAFTIESCVYYCMEFMDAGSLDKLTGTGKSVTDANGVPELPDGELLVPEPVLRRITAGIVRGLRFLKDELQIMHRDVKPTNVLINRKGEVKLCDFGVSGQLEKSLAKTNIGCQSYMAPERIKGESQNQVSTYTVSSDVWSVGLSIVELAKGCYPYPPETFANVFAQLTAIVHGPAPALPPGYSDDANDFVAKCLEKNASSRPTYAELLEHPFLKADEGAEVDMEGWVAHALERQASRGTAATPSTE